MNLSHLNSWVGICNLPLHVLSSLVDLSYMAEERTGICNLLLDPRTDDLHFSDGPFIFKYLMGEIGGFVTYTSSLLWWTSRVLDGGIRRICSHLFLLSFATDLSLWVREWGIYNFLLYMFMSLMGPAYLMTWWHRWEGIYNLLLYVLLSLMGLAYLMT